MDDSDDPKRSTSREPTEFDRFRDLTKRLLQVSKKAINGQGEKQKAKKKAG
jgi:hypothetical protein